MGLRGISSSILVIVLSLFSSYSSALDQSKVLNLMMEKGMAFDQVGIIVADDSGKVLAFNEKKHLKPASLTKILTAGTALELFGTDFQFKSQLLTDGSIENNVLKGSIYLRAHGDPTFNAHSLTNFLNALKNQKIKTIDGDIVIDDSKQFDIHSAGTKSWQRTPNPGNYPLFVNVDPPPKVQPGSRSWKSAKKRLRRLIALNEDYVVYQNMVQPDLWTGQDFLLLLRNSKIRVTGRVVRGNVPEGASEIAVLNTPLTLVIHDMLKSSNNFYADMLIRNFAIHSGADPLTMEAGIKHLDSFLDRVGVSHEDYSLYSGSGFTHSGFITAGALCAVLNYLRAQPTVSTVFYNSLPVAGLDGTLRFRMRRTEAVGRIHAKTGYLASLVSRTKSTDGVVALAGFATPSAEKNLTFVFLYNGKLSPNLVRSIFDKMCVILVTES
jgi:D-alanyl-D-alanine carboxypeptidase/D-alanyl-D-alanine-endopeptidase (penicillin-binding protein 4)